MTKISQHERKLKHLKEELTFMQGVVEAIERAHLDVPGSWEYRDFCEAVARDDADWICKNVDRYGWKKTRLLFHECKGLTRPASWRS